MPCLEHINRDDFLQLHIHQLVKVLCVVYFHFVSNHSTRMDTDTFKGKGQKKIFNE